MAPPADWFQFGSLPRIYAAPVHVSLSAGKGKRNSEASPRGGLTERVRPPLGCGPALVPGDSAAVRTLDGGEAVGRELRSGRRGAGGGGNAGRGEGAGAHGRGAAAAGRTGPPPRGAATSRHLLLALVVAAAAVERREQVEAEAEAAADGGRQEGVVGAGHLVILEVAVAVALRLADHDAHRGAVERGRQQVVRHVDNQPARAQHGHQLVLAQQREEVEAQGQQPEEHGHEEREVHRALVPACGDGDPEGGAGQQLQQPQHAQRAAQKGPLQAHRAAGRPRLGRRLARGRREHGPRARWRRRRRPEQRNGDVWLAEVAWPTCP